ncbi:MAG: glycosyltransferase family 39 protein [Acidobacteriota bacterium]
MSRSLHFFFVLFLVLTVVGISSANDQIPPSVVCDPAVEPCLHVTVDAPVLPQRHWRGEDLLVSPLGRQARFTIVLSSPATTSVTCVAPQGITCEPTTIDFDTDSWNEPHTVTVTASENASRDDALDRLELRIEQATEPSAILLVRRLDDRLSAIEKGATVQGLAKTRWHAPTGFGWGMGILLTVFWLMAWWRGDGDRRRLLLTITVTVLVADLLAVTLQQTIGRWAPWVLLGDLSHGQVFGTPSRWAANVAAALFVVLASRASKGPALLGSLGGGLLGGLIGWSQGLGFVSDLVLGSVLGLAVGIGVSKLLERLPLIESPGSDSDQPGWRLAGVGWRPMNVGWWVLGLFFLYRLAWLAVARFDLAADEAQYWDWSRHLDWAYYSKPPLIGWLNAVGRWLFGVETAVVRGGAWVLAVISTVASGLCAHALFRDRRITLLTMLILTIMPLSAVGSMLMTTDIPLIACWALWMWLVAKALFSGPPPTAESIPDAGRRRAWLWSGVVLGIGLLGKYAMAYHVLTLVLFFAVAAEHRRWLRFWQPWASVVIGFVLFSPVLWWNASQGWVGARHVAEQAGATKGFQLTLRWLGEFIGAQIGLVSPVLFVVMMMAMVRLIGDLRRGRSRDLRPQIFLVATMTPIVLIVAKSLQDKVQANWAATGWLGGGLLAAWYLVKRWDEATDTRARGRVRCLGVWALGTAVVLSMLAFNLQVVQQIFDLPPGRDPAKKVIGWRTLGQETSRRLLRMPNPDETFIFTPRYQLASALAFYTEGQPRTININLGRRMNQYDLWEGVEGKTGWDAIYVVETSRDELPTWLADDFAHHLPPETVDLVHAGTVYRTMTLWRLYGFDGTLSGTLEATRF